MKLKPPKVNKSHGSGEFKPEDFRKLGKGVIFEKGVLVFHPENIEIGDNVYIGHYTILKGYYKNLMIIDNHTWIGQQCFLHSAGGLSIGKLTQPQESLWWSILPDEVRTLPEILAFVDSLLNDKQFLEPFRIRFDTKVGRPSISVETYIRMMFLKRYHNIGYEILVKRVQQTVLFSGRTT